MVWGCLWCTMVWRMLVREMLVSIILVLAVRDFCSFSRKEGGGVCSIPPHQGEPFIQYISKSVYIYIWVRQPSKKYLVCIIWPTVFWGANNLQNLGFRVRISIYYKLLQTKNYVKRKKCDKHLPPVQSITHLCNKFLLSISFYQISYGTTKPFIWRGGATIPSNKYGALKKCCPASATHIVHP